jgi:hypothetical protein
MLAMQTLGVSDSTPKSESRIKNLLWPSICSASDVDYLGIQGYWVCVVVSGMTLVMTLFFLGAAQYPIVLGSSVLYAIFFYVGGIGVRERNRFAAAIVFAVYAMDTAGSLLTTSVSAGMLIKLAFTLVLFSNLRATWIGARWVPGTDEAALPPRRSVTLGDKFVDQWPQWVWPGIRLPYYVFSALILLLTVVGLGMSFLRRA